MSDPTDAELAQARADPRRALGRYLLLGELGRGGMGVVFRAWDDGVRRVVALKLMAEEAADPDAQRRFAREVEAMSRLQHPGIVPVLDAGVAAGRRFLVMPLLEGGSLQDRAAGLPLARRAALVRDVARAVHAAHRAGIVHRDLKPQNVLLDEHGTPRVMDLGLARFVDGKSRLTRTGASVGTAAYMAPEQLEGSAVDARADVWALGGILYFVLTGRGPFDGQTQVNIWTAILKGQVTAPSQVAPDVPPALEAVALRCLRPDPAGRFQSAEAVAQAIDAALAAGREPARSAARPRAALVLAAAALAAVGLVGLAAGLALTRASPPPPPPEAPTTPGTEAARASAPPPATERLVPARAEPEELGSFVVGHTVRRVAVRPGGQQVAAAYEGPSRTYTGGGVGLWTPGSGGIPSTYLGGFDEGFIVAYSSDGRRLLASGRSRTIVQDVETRALLLEQDGDPEKTPARDDPLSVVHVMDAVFLDDPRTLLVADNKGRVCRVDVASGQKAFLVQLAGFQLDQLDVLGDSFLGTPPPRTGERRGRFTILSGPLEREVAPREVDVGGERGVVRACFADGGRTIVAGDRRRCALVLWDGVASGVERLPGDGRGGLSWIDVAGKLVVGACQDGSVIAWDVVARRQLWRIAGAHDEATAVDLTPDGELLATGGREGRVRLWRLPGR